MGAFPLPRDLQGLWPEPAPDTSLPCQCFAQMCFGCEDFLFQRGLEVQDGRENSGTSWLSLLAGGNGEICGARRPPLALLFLGKSPGAWQLSVVVSLSWLVALLKVELSLTPPLGGEQLIWLSEGAGTGPEPESGCWVSFLVSTARGLHKPSCSSVAQALPGLPAGRSCSHYCESPRPCPAALSEFFSVAIDIIALRVLLCYMLA